ncbi:Type 1 glutamine amidotransferase-like domain-containing protein [Candidatus Saccharibacteria bacterium]|nr:Type 1 glutamine amidotransferase-like domain-containing protein [Candidatus Saccharibacteria bacterium]
MRLFLTSHDFGNYKAELLDMLGSGRKALLITNARDYYSDEDRASVVAAKMDVLKSAGFSVEELDLRQYFGKQEELADYIEKHNPDLIYAIGGNVFLLATAYHLSGLDKIIREDLAEDKYVYSGNSAGAMATSETLKYYGHDNLIPERVKEVYGVDSAMEGLGLIKQFIVAHADVPKHKEITKMYLDRIEQDSKEAIILNQTGAFIVDGEIRKLLP